LDEAAAAYAELASDEAVPADWRDQAACKRAAALARRGQAEKALALYREILDRPPSQGSDQFWFLKAGLEAARLLEEQKDWSAAVAIYDRMASASGAQREELEQRARKLRLEHFIWEN
jgi:tetratricopeptide (TPR) repeat protein